MKKNIHVLFKKISFSLVTLLWAPMIWAQVFPVPAIERSFSGAADPTMTFLWEGKEAKAVLLLIPGGEGHIGINPDRKDLGGFYKQVLGRLSNPALSTGSFDVVIFDSPQPLLSSANYPFSRLTPDHLSRIESVAVFYKEKLNKPIWLMGHSNGAVSITAFYKDLQKRNKDDLIEGLIFSGGRNGASFGASINKPLLFLHHEKDGCINTTPNNSQAVFKQSKEINLAQTAYQWISTGEPEAKNPCQSGHHMYFGAGHEVAKAIEAFVLPFYSTQN